MTQDEHILTVSNLSTHFSSGGGFGRGKHVVRAVDDVSFSIRRGTTLGLVGESGSGKTTVGRTLLRLIPATAGEAVFDGQSIFDLSSGEMRRLRSRVQMIFQDPVSSLDPRMTVGSIVAEPLVACTKLSRRERHTRVCELLERTGLSSSYIRRYPHEFSGGQRQRIGIARALATNPEFIVCDEPVSALDVSIQAQILNLLQELQDELGLTYLFIAHNLAVVEHFVDELAVMCQGKIVEHADRDTLYATPQHEYTKNLLNAVPSPDPTAPKLSARTGRTLPPSLPRTTV